MSQNLPISPDSTPTTPTTTVGFVLPKIVNISIDSITAVQFSKSTSPSRNVVLKKGRSSLAKTLDVLALYAVESYRQLDYSKHPIMML